MIAAFDPTLALMARAAWREMPEALLEQMPSEFRLAVIEAGTGETERLDPKGESANSSKTSGRG